MCQAAEGIRDGTVNTDHFGCWSSSLPFPTSLPVWAQIGASSKHPIRGGS